MTQPDIDVGSICEVATSEVSAYQLMLIEIEEESIEQETSYEHTIIPPEQATERKPWMSYTAVTDETSEQYRLLQQAVPDENGLLWIDGHVCVALGSKFGAVGSRYTFVMSNGSEVPVIKADAKQDAHTMGGEGWLGTDGHLMEMIVDTDCLHEEAMYHGSCDCLVGGTVVEVRLEE